MRRLLHTATSQHRCLAAAPWPLLPCLMLWPIVACSGVAQASGRSLCNVHWLRLQAETPAREEGGPERVVTQGLPVPEPVVAMLREHAAFLQDQGQPGLPNWFAGRTPAVWQPFWRPEAFPMKANQQFWQPLGTSLPVQIGPGMLRAAAWLAVCNVCAAKQYLPQLTGGSGWCPTCVVSLAASQDTTCSVRLA